MAIILDTNCFANVFSRSAAKHSEYSPVLEWVLVGKGFFIYGGSQYMKELRTCTSYLKLLNELRLVGKAQRLDKAKVDKIQEIIERKIPDEKFDDKHLPAMVIVSRCKLICSNDKRSIKYVTDTWLYPKGVSKPKYYTGLSNKDLLCDKNVDKSLKPLCKINKNTRDKIYKMLEKGHYK